MTSPSVPAADEQLDAGTIQPVETEKISDEELLRRIQTEIANREQSARAANKPVTLMDLYHQTVSLVAGALGYRTPKLRSEAHAVKLWELTLMWALNNRQGPPSHEILPTEDLGSVGVEPEEPDEAPIPDEVIEASENQSDTTEA